MGHETHSFLAVVDRAQALLAARRRISLGALRRELDLDDEWLDDLAEELVSGQQVAVRDGNVLAWCGTSAAGHAATRALQRPEASGARGSASSHALNFGERRQLTVMFCDLVGSTELSQRVDPEELAEILREYRAVCVEATKRFDGHLAQYRGDGVLLYFGFPQAHEDDAGRAIRAGLEIQRVLGERPGPHHVDARIGVHTGLVVVDPPSSGDDSLALGATFNVAARVQGVAKPGAVVVSDATLALCRGVFISRNLGEIALKGVDEPMLLHQVDRSAGVRSVLASDPARPMVGRDREVAVLLERWEQVQRGHGQVVLVTGDAGMGKSRLLQALREELGPSAHVWLDMQCSSFSAGSAFQPLIDLFNTAVGFSAGDTPESMTERLVDGLATMEGLPCERVIPYLLPLLSLPASKRYPLPQTSAEQQRERTLTALILLHRTVAAHQPIVMVAEDLHWSDPSTREYLTRVVECAPGARLLLVMTYRTGFHARFAHPHVSELKLDRLSRRVTRELITNVVGGRLPEPVLAELEMRSDGVPLFVEELATGVLNSGILSRRDERYELRGSVRDLAIPTTLQDSLMARLDRLSASKRVAQQAATLGRDFSYAMIEAVADVSTPALRHSLDQLVAAEILHGSGAPPDARYTFKHALLRDTAYESQLLSTRRKLHGRIAAVLEELYPERVELEPEATARHWAAAGAHAKAVDHYQRAAELAVARLSNREASEHYALALTALAELPEDAERQQREIALQVAFAKVQMALHGYDAPAVVAAFARVEALCEAVGVGPQQLAGLIGLVQVDMASGRVDRYRRRVDQILGIAEPLGIRELVVMCQVLIGTAMTTSGSALKSERHLSEAAALANQTDLPGPATPNDLDLVCVAHFNHAVAQVLCGRPDGALASVQLARERAERLDHDCSRGFVAAEMAIVGFLMDDPEYTRMVADEALAIAADRGFHSVDLIATVMRGWARARGGEVDAAIVDVERGIGLIASTGSAAGMPMVYIVAADVFRMAGHRARAEELLDRATALYERSGEIGYAVSALLVRAQVQRDFEPDDPSGAEAALLAVLEKAHALCHFNAELLVNVELARLAPRTGNVREAHDRLAKSRAALSEGFDRRPARDADAALDALSRRLDTHSRAI